MPFEFCFKIVKAELEMFAVGFWVQRSILAGSCLFTGLAKHCSLGVSRDLLVVQMGCEDAKGVSSGSKKWVPLW